MQTEYRLEPTYQFNNNPILIFEVLYILHSDKCLVYKGYLKGVYIATIVGFLWMCLLIYLAYLGSNYEHFLENRPFIRIGERDLVKHLSWTWPLLAMVGIVFPMIYLAPCKMTYHLGQGALEIRIYGLTIYSVLIKDIYQINRYYRSQRVFGALFSNRKHVLSLKLKSGKEINIVPTKKKEFSDVLIRSNPSIIFE